MGTSKQFHMRFRPRGVCDTIDGDNVIPGALSSLVNLIPDPSTPNSFICRPASTKLIDFTVWAAAPGTVDVVTVAYQVSNIIYGLVGITSGTYAGKDYPFAYDTATSAFLPVTGITAAKCPTSQATAGAWVPPQMTLTGIDLITTHIGFDGVTYFFGYFDLTNLLTPAWNAGNTATHALPSIPQAAQTFNNRTYFFCGNVAYYTDTLAIAMTNANQSLTLGDLTPVTCAAPLPTSNSSLAIVQGILAYKLSAIYLITGDTTLSNLGSNQLSSSVGTAAPRSVVPTPEGVAFMAVDGIRNVDFIGRVSEPNADLAIPFIYAVTPSRVCAAFNADTYRICVQNGNFPGSPYQDYWYNIHYDIWTGPHSFRYDLAVPLSNDFVLASNTLPAAMWDSFTVQGHNGTGSSFTENGAALTWTYTTSPMTDLDNLYANCANRSTIEIAAPALGVVYNFTAQDENGTTLGTCSVTTPNNAAIWGAFIWGAANWGAMSTGLTPVTIPWEDAIVFSKLSVMVGGPSSLGFRIGSLHLGYKRLNYFLN